MTQIKAVGTSYALCRCLRKFKTLGPVIQNFCNLVMYSSYYKLVCLCMRNSWWSVLDWSLNNCSLSALVDHFVDDIFKTSYGKPNCVEHPGLFVCLYMRNGWCRSRCVKDWNLNNCSLGLSLTILWTIFKKLLTIKLTVFYALACLSVCT